MIDVIEKQTPKARHLSLTTGGRLIRKGTAIPITNLLMSFQACYSLSRIYRQVLCFCTLMKHGTYFLQILFAFMSKYSV